jgi:hypothetical protein
MPQPHVGEPATQQPGHHDQHDQVRRDRPKAQVEGPAVIEERDHRVSWAGPPGEHLHGDVDRQEACGGEGGGAVRGLGGDPAARGHDRAVGGGHADPDRGGQRDKRETPA